MAQTILGHKSNGVIDHPYSSGSSKSQHSNSDSIKKFKYFDIWILNGSVFGPFIKGIITSNDIIAGNGRVKTPLHWRLKAALTAESSFQS